MARKSAASRIVRQGRVPEVRPKPPAELTANEAKEWDAIVGAMPADWFTSEMFPMLSALCTAIVATRGIAKEMRKAKPGTAKHTGLAKLFAQYTEMMSRLATRLKLTPQSRYHQTDAKKATKEAAAARQRRTPWHEEALGTA